MAKPLKLVVGTVLIFGLVSLPGPISDPEVLNGPLVQLVRIDDNSPNAELRRQRLVARLDRTPHLNYAMSTVSANILALEDIREALRSVPDRQDVVVLAGSGLMAQAAAEHFINASILFASQHDPWEVGLMPSTLQAAKSITGFTYDSNVVPQVLSILERSGFPIRRVAIVADQFLAGPWSTRVEDMRKKYGAYQFEVFQVDSDVDLEKCFAGAEADDVDAWIFLSTATYFRRFDRIKTELERRRKVAIYPTRNDVVAGGLMSYETSIPDPYGIWARQIALLSHGIPATEIPVERPSNFDLTINLDAARRIGRRFPPKVVKTASLVVFEPVPKR